MASRKRKVRQAGQKVSLLRKRSVPPPSATMSMLDAMLDDKKRKKKRRKQSTNTRSTHASQQPSRTEGRLNNIAPQSVSEHHVGKIAKSGVLPTGCLSDAPTVFPRKTASAPSTRKAPNIAGKSDGKENCARSVTTTAKSVTDASEVRKCAKSIERPEASRGLSLSLQMGVSKNRRAERPHTRRPIASVAKPLLEPATIAVQSTSKTIDSACYSTEHQSMAFNMTERVLREAVSHPPSTRVQFETVCPPPPPPSVLDDPHMSKESVRTDVSKAQTLIPKEIKAARKQQPVNNDNFVRLNLRNSSGACKGARRSKSSRWKRKGDDETTVGLSKDGSSDHIGGKAKRGRRTAQSGVDPLDDLVDGVFHGGAARDTGIAKGGAAMEDKAPKCARHQRPCKQLTVKRNTGNKGRKFYACSLPRGEQCDHFEWADDTVEAAQRAILKNSSYSGFVARQVAAYIERFKALTVPELREETKRRTLNHHGKRQQLLTRLSLWVRDEITKFEHGEALEVDQDHGESLAVCERCQSDESSVSSEEELELLLPRIRNSTPILSLQDHSMESCVKKHSTDDENGSPSDDEPVSVTQQLKQLFGHSSFREGQEWAVQRCLDRQRTLIVAPTGFGKSLCYALSASLLEGVCIVVSPLVSLMLDQLGQLPPRIPAATLSGSLSAAAMVSTIDDVLRGRIKILFVSPERLASPSFRRLFRSRWNPENNSRERQFPPVSLLCVDEAHCMSQWGHNFRPSYLRLRSLVDQIQPQSVLAMTATAGPRVATDICKALRIPVQTTKDKEPSIETGLMVLKADRDNIDVKCMVLETEEERFLMVLRLLKRTVGRESAHTNSMRDGCCSEGSTIIYVWRQRDAEVVAENLASHGVEGGIVVYHGGLDTVARSKAQSTFMRGKSRVCVATVAFGLGINKADIAAVVHLYLPASPETYLQEIGRAGRDGRSANAFALILKEEVIVRHSLAHSDLLSISQVEKILQIIRDVLLVSEQDASANGHSLKSRETPLSIAVRIDHTVQAADCKAESVETLMSLVEDTDPEQPLLRVEGTLMDSATITLKRRSLDKVASMEQVAHCILKCAARMDLNTGTVTELESCDEPPSVQKAFLAYSFGTYKFSVTRCAALLGPSAEPRHVFAALRRLQNSGELELMLDPDSKALHLLMGRRGLDCFSGPDSGLNDLAEALASQLSNNVAASSAKALRADAILKQVSIATDDVEAKEDCAQPKSCSLTRFQRLVSEYFEGEEPQPGANCHDETLPHGVAESDMRDIEIDMSHLLRDLPLSPEFQPRPSRASWFLPLRSSGQVDYTALAITKFFHGLDTPRASYSGFRRHALYGKWRHCRFKSLHTSVAEVLARKKRREDVATR